MDFKNKTVLITGASAGIGAATALTLVEQGAKVFAVARRKQRLDSLQKVAGANLIPVVDDISKISLRQIAEVVKNERIDILINNAGLAVGRDPIQDTSADAITQMIDTNLRGLIACTQLVLPQMIERKSGDIVNLGSVAGLFAYQNGSIYCATKFGVVGLTDAWRQDLLGKGIRVIGIHPGMVETEFSVVRFGGNQTMADKVYENFEALTAQDIADTIVWSLARPRHVNIQSMVVMPTNQAGVGMLHREKS